ncbi:MAG: cysteine desulfurase [Bdellovibrionales bacterium]|nr:cysteine desulfurase [Bdellovibrionales bacterium]
MSGGSLEFVRQEFPALDQSVNGHKLIYLDSAASSLKPRRVVDRLCRFYLKESANVHRGAHFLSDQATTAFEETRQNVAQFLNANSSNEIVFTKGSTEGLNLLAECLSSSLHAGDEILLTKMEHHSNIVPWQMMAEKKQLQLKFVDLNPDGTLNLDSFKKLLSEKTKIFSFVHCSNSMGTINPTGELIAMAKKWGALCILDAAQSVSFMPINVQELGCDFLVFSGHKVFGPTGIGVLWGRENLLNEFPPYQGGGSMIEKVTMKGSTYLRAPHRFEAGTPHIGGVLGLNEALKFVSELGFDNIQKHETHLAEMTREELKGLPGIRFIGESKDRANIVSFVFESAHPSDIGQILNQEGIAVRTGHHCNQLLMEYFGISGSIRASFSVYNSPSEVDQLARATRKALEFFL